MNVNKSSTTTASISRQQQHKRCVSFNPMVEVCYLESSSASPSIQEETIDSSELWWTARDYKQIKNRCVYAVRCKLYQCEMHDDSDDEIDCNIDFEYLLFDRTTMYTSTTYYYISLLFLLIVRLFSTLPMARRRADPATAPAVSWSFPRPSQMPHRPLDRLPTGRPRPGSGPLPVIL